MSKCACKPRLSKRFELQEATESQDAYGSAIKTWAKVKLVWGELEPLSGQERVVAMQTEGSITHRVRLRFDATITPKMRLKLHERGVDRIFNLMTPINVMSADREMIIVAQEVL